MEKMVSVKSVEWNEDSKLAFENLMKSLDNGFEFFRIEPDEPFILRTDASDFALGAVLELQREAKCLPVAHCSRKSQKDRKTGPLRKRNQCHSCRASQMGRMYRLPYSGSQNR